MPLTRKFLAGAIIALLPLSGAMACTVGAWNGANTTATDANSSGPPVAGFARYSGLCGLRTAASGVVVADNSPGAEATYTSRFYVHTGLTSGNAKIFSATTADDGGGSETIGITYNSGSPGNFDFSINGASIGQITGITANNWYSVDFVFQSGASFDVDVGGASGNNLDGFSQNLTVAPIAAGSVGSATMGFISGSGVGVLQFDEFDSTRSTTKIGRLCRGDANGSGTVTAGDRFTITQELALPPVVAVGQPDCNESGTITASDRFCVTTKLADLVGDVCR